MSASPYDFRAALSGEQEAPVDEEEEQTQLLRTLTAQESTASSGSGGAPLNLNLATGLLRMNNGSGDLEVDTADQRVVIDPDSPSEVGRRDGAVVLGTTDEDEPTSKSVLADGESVPEGEVTEPLVEPVHVVSVREPTESELAEDFSSTEDTPLTDGVSAEFTPAMTSVPATEAVPVSATIDEAPDDVTDAAGPVVTVDPDTGETVILAEDLRITVGPENGEIRIEPSDENVPLAPDAPPITVEAGGLTMAIDPATGTLEVTPIKGEFTDITVETGDLRIVMDGETGEISIDPGEGSVSTDPETGLVTIEPTGVGGEEDAGDPGDGQGADNRDAGDDTGTGNSPGGKGDHGEEHSENRDDAGQEPPNRGQNADGQGGHPSGEGQGPGMPGTVPGGTGGIPPGGYGGGEPDEQVAGEKGESDDDQGGDSEWSEVLAPTEITEPSERSFLAPGPDTEPDPNENQDEPTPDGGQQGGGEEDEEDSEDEKDKEDEEDGDDGEEKEKDDEDGDDKGDKGGGGEGGDGGDTKDKGTKIDLDRIAVFRDEFIIKVRDALESQTPNFYDYSGDGSSEGAAQVTRLGDPSLLEIAGVLGSRLDRSMAMLHSILIEFEEEFEGIQDRLYTNMNIFDDLESDQELTAGQVALIMDGSESASGGAPTP